MKRIDSPTNPLIKLVARLVRPQRRESRIVLEGRKLVDTALECGVAVETILVSSTFDEVATASLAQRGPELVVVRDSVFQRVSSLERSDGVLAVAPRPLHDFARLEARGQVVVTMGVHDPGNLGAVSRVAEAAGALALVCTRGTVDPFGTKALRGSMGSLLRLPVYEVEDDRVLKERGFRTAALEPRGGTDFRRAELAPPLALLVGGESQGLSRETVARADLRVTIPMKGQVESLNVATAAALVLFEATRRDSQSEIS